MLEAQGHRAPLKAVVFLVGVLVGGGPAVATELAQAALAVPHLDGRSLGLVWVVPFAGLLLSIALGPLFVPKLWDNHYGKIAAFWSLVLTGPFALIYGFPIAGYELLHVVLTDYLPFIILLTTLYTVTGGIRLTGDRLGTPGFNTVVIALGTILASIMGTTGASMMVIRPLLHANRHRRHVVHTVVFTIFLVANIGGALTPLGDPPLFLGFLHGVSFFWTAQHLWLPTLMLSVVLLGLYFVLDCIFLGHEPPQSEDPGDSDPVVAEAEGGGEGGLRLEGGINLALLLAIVGAVLLSGVWTPKVSFSLYRVPLEVQNLARDFLLLGITAASLLLTPPGTRAGNLFTWHPIMEVAKLFAGIFITIVPAVAMLRAGPEGALAAVVAIVTDSHGRPDNGLYFWVTGALSSFLDNAPTYLVFFNTAGGDAAGLMAHGPATLAAISAGAVYMGAMTYIGNAPNMMIKSIAERRGVVMPGFFAYMAWSGGLLIPLFLLTSVLFFR
ncbi:Sodium:proton antiporter [uncultured Gammaproteobacteria bacterium]